MSMLLVKLTFISLTPFGAELIQRVPSTSSCALKIGLKLTVVRGVRSPGNGFRSLRGESAVRNVFMRAGNHASRSIATDTISVVSGNWNRLAWRSKPRKNAKRSADLLKAQRTSGTREPTRIAGLAGVAPRTVHSGGAEQ